MARLPKSGRLNYLPKAKKDRKPTSDQGFYNLTSWRKVRKIKIKQDPFCEVHLFKNQLVDCTFDMPIDHIVGIETYKGARLDLRNLMTMCDTCHARKSTLEGKYGCLVKTVTVEGENIPAEGERERLIEELCKYIV